MSCSFSVEAYGKIVLHAAKYPTNSICGLLMGVADVNIPAMCTVTDSIPVCHNAPAGPIFDLTADVVSFVLHAVKPAVLLVCSIILCMTPPKYFSLTYRR